MDNIVRSLMELADQFDKDGFTKEAAILDDVIVSIAKKKKKSKSSDCREKYYNKKEDHFKGPDRFASCVKYQKCLGKSAESAKKICGYIKHHVKGGLAGVSNEEKEWSRKIIAESEKELNIITLAQMENICPECAQEMRKAGVDSIEVDAQLSTETEDNVTLGSLLLDIMHNTNMQMGQGKALEKILAGTDLRQMSQSEMYQALKGLVSLLNVNI